MSRSLLQHTRTIIAMSIIGIAAACDRESPTDVPRPQVKANPAQPNATTLLPPIGDPEKPVTGYEVKTFGFDVVSGYQGVVEVQCSPGNRALGGGYRIGGSISITGPDVTVYESSPNIPTGGDGWRLNAINRGAETRRFDVWVICAPF